MEGATDVAHRLPIDVRDPLPPVVHGSIAGAIEV
jgi:hypothetical protein